MFSLTNYQYAQTSSSRFKGSKSIIYASVKLLILIMVIGCTVKIASGRIQKISTSQAPLLTSTIYETKDNLNDLSLVNGSSDELSVKSIERYFTDNLKAVEKIFISGIR